MGFFSKKEQPKTELPLPPPFMGPGAPAHDNSPHSQEVPKHEEHAEAAPHPDPLHIPVIHTGDGVEEAAPETAPQALGAQINSVAPVSLHIDTPAPIFVSVGDYQTILEGIETIKRGLGNTEAHISMILELKGKQDRTLDEWKSHLDDVQKKLNYIDEVLFKVR